MLLPWKQASALMVKIQQFYKTKSLIIFIVRFTVLTRFNHMMVHVTCTINTRFNIISKCSIFELQENRTNVWINYLTVAQEKIRSKIYMLFICIFRRFLIGYIEIMQIVDRYCENDFFSQIFKIVSQLELIVFAFGPPCTEKMLDHCQF